MPNLKILVVEDSKAHTLHYKNILESQGHRVYVAYDGKEELKIYEKELNLCGSSQPPFDLIISDNSMTEINGVDAGQKILNMMPIQKFFFVTGEKDIILNSFNVDKKNIDVEQKPLETKSFLQKVNLLTT